MKSYQIMLDDGIIVDNFAGGGGASTGIEAALNSPVNIAINHNAEAISMHQANHPLTEHHIEDVWKVHPMEVTKGRRVRLAWFSPDCTHHSRARGQKPVQKKIRGLAWVAVRWADIVKPDVIMLENVEEFEDWGPVVQALNDDGTPKFNDDGSRVMIPCTRRKGVTFRSFVNALKRLGYVVEWRPRRACDFGDPTIRKRLLLIARRDGKPIVWPAPTHGPKGTGLTPYRTAAECIDWSIPCPSIFERERPLAENTMRRIAMGIKKFVIEAKQPFIVNVNHTAEGYDQFRGQSLTEPMKTMTGKNGFALATPFVQHVQHSTRPDGTMPADEPLRTITATPKGGGRALVAPVLVGAGGPVYSGKPKSVDEPLNSILRENHSALVTAFLAKHFGGNMTPGCGLEGPISTVTAKDHHALVAASIMKMKGTCKHGQPADEPLHTVAAGGTHHAAVTAFLIKYFGTDQDPRLDEPMHTVTTKDRFGLVTIHGEEYQIVDIGMRMLTPRELYRAQGFPESYIIDMGLRILEDGIREWVKLSKAAQVKMCGNSVPPGMVEAHVRANVEAVFSNQKVEKRA